MFIYKLINLDPMFSCIMEILLNMLLITCLVLWFNYVVDSNWKQNMVNLPFLPLGIQGYAPQDHGPHSITVWLVTLKLCAIHEFVPSISNIHISAFVTDIFSHNGHGGVDRFYLFGSLRVGSYDHYFLSYEGRYWVVFFYTRPEFAIIHNKT